MYLKWESHTTGSFFWSNNIHYTEIFHIFCMNLLLFLSYILILNSKSALSRKHIICVYMFIRKKNDPTLLIELVQ